MKQLNYPALDGDPNTLTNPFRPSVDDFGGAGKIDDANFPPDPTTMVCASDWNQLVYTSAALSQVAPAALLQIRNDGTAFISSMRSLSSRLVTTPIATIADGVIACGDFLVTRHGVGDVEITCPATKLMQPFAAVAVSQKTGDWRVSAYVNATNDGIRVETHDDSGTLADVDFGLIWI